MEKKYRLIPFDVEKAKGGAEVVTRCDCLNVEILKYDLKYKDFPILALINHKDGSQTTDTYGIKGNRFIDAWNGLDLRIKEEVKVNSRRMTNQELAWWLRDCPDEHREWKWTPSVVVNNNFTYIQREANEECPEDIFIRSNGGEWREPLVEIE